MGCATVSIKGDLVGIGVSIVVPTYNEKENIPELLKKIESVVGLNHVYEVIVVDDSSPDGTYDKTREMSEKYLVKAIKRENGKGLATAVLRGVEESSSDTIVVMDAQHPPEKIPELVSEIDKGKDIAIGSRFVEGGSVGDFGLFRNIISRGADLLARTVFEDVRNVKDIQSGFFAFKKNILNNSKDFNPVGYKILLELLVMGNHGEVSEVGYEFGERKSGESKLGIVSILDYLQHLWSLAWRKGEISRFIKFCIVGGTGALVNLGLTYSLTSLGLFYPASGAIAIEASLLTNFFFNKLWTFQDRAIKGFKAIFKALGRDHLVRFGGMVLNLLILWILTEYFGLWYMISQTIGIGVATLWNFGGNKLWTWGN